MGLESIRIENFRTCRSVELSNLGHLTVLVGKNGVGKSNILQGIEWVARAASSINPVPQDTLNCKMVFRADNKRYFYTFAALPRANGEFDFKETLDLQASEEQVTRIASRINQDAYDQDGERIADINKATPLMPALGALLSQSIAKQGILSSLNFVRGVKYYSLDEPGFYVEQEHRSFISRSFYDKWISAKPMSVSPMDDVMMRLLHMWIERHDDFEELDSILGSHGLGIIDRVLIKRVKSDGYFFYILPGQEWGSVIAKLDYGKLSYGTRRVINLLVSIFYDKSSVYLFEQPEDGIHPELLYKLIDLLRGYPDKGQIIMASHSSALLNELRPEEIRLVTMTGGETQVRALSDSELKGAKLFLEQEGPLSQYLESLEEY